MAAVSVKRSIVIEPPANSSRSDSFLVICHFKTKGKLEPKCVPQLLLGSLLLTRQSAIAHFFLSLVTVPEVFANF